jgi:hypothetical protein
MEYKAFSTNVGIQTLSNSNILFTITMILNLKLNFEVSTHSNLHWNYELFAYPSTPDVHPNSLFKLLHRTFNLKDSIFPHGQHMAMTV